MSNNSSQYLLSNSNVNLLYTCTCTVYNCIINPIYPLDAVIDAVYLLQILELLWSLAHLPQLSRETVELALNSHYSILIDSYHTRDQERRLYIGKCADDIKKVTLNAITLCIVLHVQPCACICLYSTVYM